jgi:hypothetical protein
MARFKNSPAKIHNPSPITTGNTNQKRNTINTSPAIKKQAATPPYSNLLEDSISSGMIK